MLRGMFPDTEQIHSYFPKELAFEALRGFGSPDGSASLKNRLNSFCLRIVSWLWHSYSRDCCKLGERTGRGLGCVFCLHSNFWFPFLGLFVFSISSAGQAYLIKVHAYLKGGMLLNSTSINLNCATLPPLSLIPCHWEIG